MHLQELVSYVVEKLNCGGQVRPVLYKGMLYEKGGYFSFLPFHKDMEKEKNMFVTLMRHVTDTT